MKTRFIAYFGSKIKDENTMRTRTLAVHIGASNRTVLVSLVDQRITFIDAVNFLFGEVVYVDALGEIIMKLYIPFWILPPRSSGPMRHRYMGTLHIWKGKIHH